MKKISIAIILSCLSLFAFGGTNTLIINSFGNGRLQFSTLSNATSYQVQWAPTASGPWTNTWDSLTAISPTNSDSITVDVPMFYRVVATITNYSPIALSIPEGTNSGTYLDEWNNPHSYTVSSKSLQVDETEITEVFWNEIKNWGESNGFTDLPNASTDQTDTYRGKGNNYPVCYINWYDALKWCNARSESEGKVPVYYLDESFSEIYRTGDYSTHSTATNDAERFAWQPIIDTSADGYRLPTLEEYQYISRGGVVGKRFPWGDTISHSNANYRGSSGVFQYDESDGYHPDYSTDTEQPYIAPVASFSANGFGVYDISGNVAEWCWDAYDATRNRTGGGDWFYQAFHCLSSAGETRDKMQRDSTTGFRTVKNTE